MTKGVWNGVDGNRRGEKDGIDEARIGVGRGARNGRRIVRGEGVKRRARRGADTVEVCTYSTILYYQSCCAELSHGRSSCRD